VLRRAVLGVALALVVACADDADVATERADGGRSDAGLAGDGQGDAGSTTDAGVIIGETMGGAPGDGDAAGPLPTPADAGTGVDAAPDVAMAPAPEFFQTEVVHRIEITMDPAGWQAYMQDHVNYGLRPMPRWFAADFRIDGVQLRNVAFHVFGFGSRLENKQKPNLSLDINRNVPGQSLAGVTRMRIKNNGQDVSGLRQVITYEAMRKANLLAPKSTYAELVVNGEPYGFYSIEEAFTRRFVRERVGNDNGPAYEAQDCRGLVAPQDGCERIVGWYNRDFNETVGEGEDLIALCNAVNGPPERFMTDVPALLNFSEWIDQIAINTALLGDNDGYSRSGANFRLYHDTALNKFRLIVLGPDDTYAPGRLPLPDPLRPAPKEGCLDPDAGGPQFRDIFLERLISTPEGLAMYQQAVKKMRTGVFAPAALKARVDELWTIIGPHVKADKRNVQYMDPDEFKEDIKKYVDLRWPALEQAGL
jgi:hypothetical protein